MDIGDLLALLQGRRPLSEEGSISFSGKLLSRDLKSLVAELTDHQHLKSLTLRNCHIDDEGADLLSRVVAFNTVLERLDLSHNQIGSQGAQLLANALKIYNSGALKALCLADNPCVSQMPELFAGASEEGTLGCTIDGHGPLVAPGPFQPQTEQR